MIFYICHKCKEGVTREDYTGQKCPKCNIELQEINCEYDPK